jgi:hypothetical protein
MAPTKNQREILISLLLAFTLFSVTSSQVIAQDGYKNDTNPLPNIYESAHAEGGYKANIVINPLITGAYRIESGTGGIFKLDLTIIQSGVGNALSENGFKLDLVPQKSFPELHNQKIEYIILQKTIVGQGMNVTIQVVVSNQEFTLETSKLGIYAWNVTTINITEQNFALRSKAETTVSYKWTTTSIPYNYYRIDTYAFPLPGETFTNDNTLHNGRIMITIPGDVNGDRTVDVFDVLKIKYHRSGPPPGPGGYNTNVDVNDDGTIDVFDILIAKAYLGQSW